MKTHRIRLGGSASRSKLAWVAVAAALATTGGSLAAASSAQSATDPSLALAASCGAMPGSANTGASGTLAASSKNTMSAAGSTLANARITGDLTVSGDNVVVRNVSVTGNITVLGNGVKLDRVTTKGVVISGAANVTVQYANISKGGEGIHVTADRGSSRPVSNISLHHNYIHDPAASQSGSYSGTHLRGGTGIDISCSRYDGGAVGNGALFLENANGGTSGVRASNNWLNGGGFTVFTGANDVRLTSNVFGRDAKWGSCDNRSAQPLTVSGNRYTDGAAFAPCGGPESTPPPTTTTTATPKATTTTTPPPTTTTTPPPTTTTTAPPPTTTTTTPPPTTTTTTAPPATTPPPAPNNACAIKPAASNTGASGTRTNSSQTTLNNGAVLENANVSSLTIYGSNVTVRNVSVAGSILVAGDNVMIDRVTTQGIGISSASNVTVQYANIGFGPDDAIHVTSDGGRYINNVTLKYNYMHDPRVAPSAHYDGIQVRGAANSTIACNTIDPGPFQETFNAAVYLEDANGGENNIVVQNNWLYGFAFSVMMDARNTQLLGNQLGGDIHWGECYLGTRVGNAGLISTGNTRNGQPTNLCK